MSQWISANRPPDSNRAVLALRIDGSCTVVNYAAEAIWYHWRSAETGAGLIDVTHWCGLPLKPAKRGRK